MKVNPDNRENNCNRIQYNISNTIRNIDLANEAIEKTDNEATKAELESKNERRREALEGMRSEIREEAIAKENGYK